MCGNESRAGRGVVCATPKKVVLTFDQQSTLCDYTLARPFYYSSILLHNKRFRINIDISSTSRINPLVQQHIFQQTNTYNLQLFLHKPQPCPPSMSKNPPTSLSLFQHQLTLPSQHPLNTARNPPHRRRPRRPRRPQYPSNSRLPRDRRQESVDRRSRRDQRQRAAEPRGPHGAEVQAGAQTCALRGEEEGGCVAC